MKYKRVLKIAISLLVVCAALIGCMAFFQIRANEGKTTAFIRSTFLPDYEKHHGHYPNDLNELKDYLAKESHPFFESVIQSRRPELENVKQHGAHFEADINFRAPLGSKTHIVID